MKAYVITTLDSKRLIDGEIPNYPDILPECEVFYGPTPSVKNTPPAWFHIRRRGDLTRKHAWCCYLSKIMCLEAHIKRYPDEDCIIFEDDVVFHKRFNAVYTGFMKKVPKDWAILWFQYRTNRIATEVAPAVLTVPHCWLASMLVFRAKYIKDIINDLKEEQSLPNCEVDIAISHLSAKYPSYLPLFSVCSQRGGYSYITRHHNKGYNGTNTKYIDMYGRIRVSNDSYYKLYL